MARVNHKRVKQLIQEKQGKITDQEFFTSRLLAIHLEDLAAAQTRRYGVNRRVRVCLVWQPDRDDLAFTDNLTITLNPGHPAITQFPSHPGRAVPDGVRAVCPRTGPLPVHGFSGPADLSEQSGQRPLVSEPPRSSIVSGT